MTYDHDEAMRQQEATEAMIEMREPPGSGPHPDPFRDEVIACLRQVERAFLADVKPSTLTPDGDNVIYHLDGQTVGGALARTRKLLSAMGAAAMSGRIEDHPDTITPGEWATVADEALGVMKAAADVAAKKAADDIYARILDSAQDYLEENLRFNIASTLATAERERAEAQDRVAGLLATRASLLDALVLARSICHDAFKDTGMEWDKKSMAVIDGAISKELGSAMSQDAPEPTNEELRAALGKIASDSTQRSRANTCYAASERIYELTEALKAVHAPYRTLTDEALEAGILMEFGPPKPDRGAAQLMVRAILAKAGHSS